MRFNASGTLPTDISVKITLGSAPSWKTDAILREYDVVRTGGSGNTVTLKLHYLDSELNSNTESELDIYDYHVSALRIDDHGSANSDMTDNWVAISGRNTTYLSTSFDAHLWSLANVSGEENSWIGSVSTDWNDTNNWAGGIVPDSTMEAHIPDAATTLNDPTIPVATSIKNLHML